ncbi:regulator of RNase E activity RraA [Bradyrhizobium sp. GM24.11]
MIGFAIHAITRRVSGELANRYRGLPTANISDCMSRMAAAGARLRPMHAGGQLVGPAFTVKTRPGDNLLVHKALDLALRGDVVIVDAGGDLTNSIFGELMAAYAASRGIAGVVINGAIRDSEAIRQAQFPVHAAGVTHRGPLRSGPGEIGCSIAIDGMVIEPGDLIIGDADGLVCVPYGLAENLLPAVTAKCQAEAGILRDIQSGEGWDRSWIDKTLRELGCEF